MKSDDPRIEKAFGALAEPLERYRSSVAAAAEEVRAFLATHRAEAGTKREVGPELGAFAEGRIDFDRLASVLDEGPVVDGDTLERVQAAYETLRDASDLEGEKAFHVDVEKGEDLGQAVARGLETAGRIFAAARVAALARTGALVGEKKNVPDTLSFAEWNEAERELAPPLIVEVEGKDLQSGELVEFLDGGVKIVLAVKGDSAPAPLVRLITPGTLVLQTGDEAGLDRLAAFEGPGVAALVPNGAARFVHDPEAGEAFSSRLRVEHLPEEEPTRPVGGVSARQQAQELALLRALAESTPGGAPAEEEAAEESVPAGPPTDPVDKLASWLLHQTDLSDLEK